MEKILNLPLWEQFQRWHNGGRHEPRIADWGLAILLKNLFQVVLQCYKVGYDFAMTSNSI